MKLESYRRWLRKEIARTRKRAKIAGNDDQYLFGRMLALRMVLRRLKEVPL